MAPRNNSGKANLSISEDIHDPALFVKKYFISLVCALAIEFLLTYTCSLSEKFSQLFSTYMCHSSAYEDSLNFI